MLTHPAREETRTCRICAATFSPRPELQMWRICLDCRRQLNADWRDANTERRQAYFAEYERRPGRRARKYALNKTRITSTPERWKRHRTRRIVADLVFRKVITRSACSQCGAPNAQAHHTDYDQPLLITWLCGPCHKAEHRREKHGA